MSKANKVFGNTSSLNVTANSFSILTSALASIFSISAIESVIVMSWFLLLRTAFTLLKLLSELLLNVKSILTFSPALILLLLLPFMSLIL